MARNETTHLLSDENEQGAENSARQARSLTSYQRARSRTRSALDSKFAHYGIVFLVVLDLIIIFAEFLLQLFSCERRCMQSHARFGGRSGENDDTSSSKLAEEALGIVSLIFSCVFMVELVLSIWAFGREFFQSTFRVFDGLVIVIGFVIDVGLRGVLEEVGSVIIVLRLWRVFKVIGELSAQAAEQVNGLNEEIAQLQEENAELKRRIETLPRETD